MKTIRIKSNNILNAQIKEGYIYFANGKITAVTDKELPFDEQIDAKDDYLSAGFIDCHTHGGVDCDFSCCSKDGVVSACNYHFKHGTTAILPTVLSSDKPTMLRALDSIKNASHDEKLHSQIVGAHLEGPYFSLNQSGAQNPRFITPPIESDYTEIVEKYPGLIKKWSYAPERDEGEKFYDYLVKNDILPSIGHSDSTLEQMQKAIDKGLNNVTHLYSCTSTITREKGFRRLGIIETAYLYDNFFVELITDGKHIPLDLIKLAFKLKGAEKIMLVTDSLSVAGSGKSCGCNNGIDFIVEDGVAKLLDRSAFAGSVSTMDILIKRCVEAGIALSDAVTSATKTPAQSLGLNKGQLKQGFDADFVIFDKDINIKKVISNGRI